MQRKLSSMCILLDWFPEDVIKWMENLYVVFMHNVTYLWWITPKKVCKSRLLKGGRKAVGLKYEDKRRYEEYEDISKVGIFRNLDLIFVIQPNWLRRMISSS